MKIRTFDDIRNIDMELADFFLRPEEAVHWIETVNNGIKEWIAKHNKQHWEVVKYVAEERGILGKHKKDGTVGKLPRKDFATMLIKFCPEALAEVETTEKLTASMEHYRMENAYGRGPSGTSLARVREVEALLDNQQLPEEEDERNKEPLSIADLMADFLRKVISEQSSRNTCRSSALFVRKQYGEVTPTLSVETYFSERFRKEGRYSMLEAYVVLEEELMEPKLYELIGMYGKIPQLRLGVVSPKGLRPDVYKVARDNNVFYVRLNPDINPDAPEYILPRSVGDYEKMWHNQEVLFGNRQMDTPLLIMDGDNITASLADVLLAHGAAVKPQAKLNVPYLSNEEIELMADKLSEPYVKVYLKLYAFWDEQICCSIDPFLIAGNNGLEHETVNMSDDFQLGRLDVVKCHVTLNSSGLNNYNRFRFTMAHELGHYFMHAPLFEQCGVISFGDSEATLTPRIATSDDQLRRLEYQANLFASYLLMPKLLVGALYNHFYEIYVHQYYGDSFQALYYNPRQPETLPSYNNVVMNMASLLEVSQEALIIRLKSLKLLRGPC